MKFALHCLSCALILLGFGCTSTPKKNAAPAPVNSSSGGVGGIGGLSESPDPDEAEKHDGPAYLLRMVDYKTGARLELVNESHTSHLNQYSKVRSDPSRKVTTDEWMTGLIAYLKDQGWSKEVKSGNAPEMAQGALGWSLQLVGPEGTSFIAAPVGVKGNQATRLITMKTAFIQTYNATPGFQAVRAQPGTLPFKVPEYQKEGGKKGGK
ncbi:MAG: hypothetical protein ABI054_11150 [Planctomycetota bacterium]